MNKQNLIALLYLFILNVHFGNSEADTITNKEYAFLPRLFQTDNYDDCMLLEEEALYCSITYQLDPSSEAILWVQLKRIIGSPYNYRRDILRHGICVPKICPNVIYTLGTINENHVHEGLTECYNQRFRPLGLRGDVTKISCNTVDPKYPIDWIDVSFGFFLISYISFVIYSTFFELNRSEIECNKNQNPKSLDRILMAFSIRRNWIRLKTINSDVDTKKLRSIQGVRFYNMVLVILVHTIMTLFVTLPVSNTRATETLTDRLSTVFLASGPLCVSTFFLISSWLLMYGIFEKFKDRKQITLRILLDVFINRYIRLTPSLLLMIAFQATWLRHLGTGPYWDVVVNEEYLRCRNNWWTNVLYINNYFDVENMCMHTTWHLALDTQYFAIVLLLIWLFNKCPKSMWIILGSLLSLSIYVSFFENYANDFPALIPPTPESLYGMNHTIKNKQWHIQYIGFFGNIAGPIIGLVFGHLYLNYKNKNIFTTNIYIWIWYIIVHCCCYGVILLAGFLSLPEHIEHDIFWSSLHVAISRPIFATGMGLLLFGMTQGVGGILKSMFEWHPLYVLGRLTYSAYLVHIPLLLLKGGMVRSPVYINEYLVFFELIGHLAMSYLVATLFTLFFEMPLSELQKIVTQRSNAPTRRKSN